jgi:hypothetical protein
MDHGASGDVSATFPPMIKLMMELLPTLVSPKMNTFKRGLSEMNKHETMER